MRRLRLLCLVVVAVSCCVAMTASAADARYVVTLDEPNGTAVWGWWRIEIPAGLPDAGQVCEETGSMTVVDNDSVAAGATGLVNRPFCSGAPKLADTGTVTSFGVTGHQEYKDTPDFKTIMHLGAVLRLELGSSPTCVYESKHQIVGTWTVEPQPFAYGYGETTMKLSARHSGAGCSPSFAMPVTFALENRDERPPGSPYGLILTGAIERSH
jgi:hypothetical protein